MLLNVGSLILGLVALLLPLINLAIENKAKNKNYTALSIASLSACAIAVCMQLFYNMHLVAIKDWSALMDTMYAVAYVSLLLVVITITLNAITLVVYRKK
jgi:cytochrome c oxidase subunit 4